MRVYTSRIMTQLAMRTTCSGDVTAYSSQRARHGRLK
jgi:hypothetical protein